MPDFDDAISGWTLYTTLSPTTPLVWLKRHGEFLPGSRRPKEQPPEQFAVWLARPRTFRELGIDLPEFPPSTMASLVGQIPEDGGDFLAFLIRYRLIVEQSPDESREAEIAALAVDRPDYAHVISPKKRRGSRRPTSD